MTAVSDDVLKRMARFNSEMVRKMQLPASEVGDVWRQQDVSLLFLGLLRKVCALLSEATTQGCKIEEAIRSEAADVANFAFMIADRETDLRS